MKINFRLNLPLVLCLTILLPPLTGIAQQFIPELSSRFNKSISLEGNYFLASNAAGNNLMESYYLGKFIDQEMKDKSSSRLKSSNIAGADLSSRLGFAMRFKDDSLQTRFWSAGLLSHFNLDIEFPPDAFEIYFRGNKKFRGTTAIMDNTYIRWLAYQQFRVGLGGSDSRNGKWINWFAALSINKGQRYYSIDIPKASLYTSDDGYYLDTELSVLIRQNDSAQKSLTAWNGTGVSGSGYISIDFNNSDILSFQADNLGFISWNDNSARIPADSVFRFEGIDISNLFDFSDSVSSSVTSDSAFVQGFLTRRNKEAFSEMLPFLTRLSFRHYLRNKTYFLEAEVRHRWFSKAVPGFTLRAAYKPRPELEMELNTSFGDYSGLRAGLGLTWKFIPSWKLKVESDYLSSMIVYSKGTGQGAFVSLSKYF